MSTGIPEEEQEFRASRRLQIVRGVVLASTVKWKRDPWGERFLRFCARTFVGLRPRVEALDNKQVIAGYLATSGKRRWKKRSGKDRRIP